MTWLGAKAKAVADAIGNLASVADRTVSILKKVWGAAQGGAGLRTAVLLGSLGFFVGASAAIIACVYFGLIALSPLFAIAGGGAGIIVGLLLGRDRVFNAAGERIQDIWGLRNTEMAILLTQINELGPNGRNVAALEDKRANLSAAPPAVLEAYYGMGSGNGKAARVLADHENEYLVLLQRPIQFVPMIADQSKANTPADPAIDQG